MVEFSKIAIGDEDGVKKINDNFDAVLQNITEQNGKNDSRLKSLEAVANTYKNAGFTLEGDGLIKIPTVKNGIKITWGAWSDWNYERHPVIATENGKEGILFSNNWKVFAFDEKGRHDIY